MKHKGYCSIDEIGVCSCGEPESIHTAAELNAEYDAIQERLDILKRLDNGKALDHIRRAILYEYLRWQGEKDRDSSPSNLAHRLALKAIEALGNVNTIGNTDS
jgi:hypothetical protein